MLMDIDTRLIERPYLWTVFGKMLETEAGAERALNDLLDKTKNYRELQEDSLMYAFFNMFEAVFDFHRHLGFFGGRRRIISKMIFSSDRRRTDKEYMESWDKFAEDFFREGRRPWKLFNEQKEFYSKSFQEWVEKVHGKATTDQTDPQTAKTATTAPAARAAASNAEATR